MLGAEEVKRHVRLVPNYPAVMRIGRDVEEVSCTQLDYPAIPERGGCNPGEYEPDVLHRRGTVLGARAHAPKLGVDCAHGARAG